MTSRSTDELFEIKNDKSFRVTAVPTLNSYTTAYSFEYWTDGKKNSKAPIWSKLTAHAESLKEKVPVKAAGLLALIIENLVIFIGAVSVLLIGICICVAILCVKKKKKD